MPARREPDERIAFVTYHQARDSFVINSNIPGELDRFWPRLRDLPYSEWNREYSFIEVPASLISVDRVKALINLHNLETGKREAQVIRDLGEKARRNFSLASQTDGMENTFNVKGKPYPFQVIGAKLALENQRTIIGDQPGLGKTIQVALILSRLGAPAIIFCPRNAKYVYRTELVNWLPDVTHDDIFMVQGAKPRRLPDTRFTIVTYDIMAWWLLYLDILDRKVMIFDEIHRLGNPKSKRSKTAMFLVRNAEIVIGTSGTAAPNRPKDIIHPLAVLGVADELGGTEYLMKRFGKAPKPDSPEPDVHRYHADLVLLNEWLKKLGAYVRRRKAEVLTQLPPKIREVVPVELSNYDEYRSVETDFEAWAERVNARPDDLANIITQARLLLAGTDAEPSIRDYKDNLPVASKGMAYINTMKQLAFLGKLYHIKEMVTDLLLNGEKVILFAWFKRSQRILQGTWPEDMVRTVLGSDRDQHRQESIWRFQNDPKTRIIVCSIKATYEAITLTASANVINCELPWAPAEVEGTEDRSHRIGQTRGVTCWYPVGLNTIEEDIIDLLSEKLEQLSHLLDGQPAENLSVINALLSRLLDKKRRERSEQKTRIGT